LSSVRVNADDDSNKHKRISNDSEARIVEGRKWTRLIIWLIWLIPNFFFQLF